MLPEEIMQEEEQTCRARRLETVGQLASGVAHDFNNLLGVILGCCELLQQRTLPETVQGIINEIHQAGTCAKKLSQSLLAFSCRQVLPAVALDMNATVTQLRPLLARMIGDDIELATVLGNGLGTIEADAGHFEQILVNLAINARDAMPNGGRILIETANLDLDEGHAGQDVGADTGRYVVLTVCDEGVGMDADTQSRMFEPFFTTKLPARGTGLGLSTVHSNVQKSGGSIRVESRPGCGTKFEVRFPRRDAVPLDAERRVSIPGGTETILLVDDAAALRMLTRRILEDGGYTVLDTGDPITALRIAQEHPGPLHLLLTDVVMPALSGFDLAERMAALRPGIRLLFTSGDARPLPPSAEPAALLEKPFSRDELLMAVRALLCTEQEAGGSHWPSPGPPTQPPGSVVVTGSGPYATTSVACFRPRSA